MCFGGTGPVHPNRYPPPFKGSISADFPVYWNMSQTKIPLAQRAHSRVLPLTAKFTLADYERVRAEASTNGLPVSAYLRQKALSGTVQPPTVISPICQAQWHLLARLGTNLNRLIFLLNSGVVGAELADLRCTIEAAKVELQAVRNHLIGGSAVSQ